MIGASVIICVYNRGGQVGKCLNSLFRMDAGNFELILVDDASTDDTREKLLEFKQAHPDRSVTIVSNERNLGVAGARNAGLRAARGEFVCFTDSDCTVDRGWLGALTAAFEDPDVAGAAGLVLNVEPRNLAERAYVGGARIGQTPRRHRSLIGGNMAFRRDLLLEYPFDEQLTYGCDEDDLAWRLHRDGHRLAWVPRAVVCHDHPMTLRTYWRQGYRQGRGSALHWYKRGIYVGRDLWALAACLFTMPLGFVDVRLLLIPGLCFLLQVAAIVYNETALKGKGLLETARILPVCVVYYGCKAWSVLITLLRILVRLEPTIRTSRRR